jgi:hypothetical protein
MCAPPSSPPRQCTPLVSGRAPGRSDDLNQECERSVRLAGLAKTLPDFARLNRQLLSSKTTHRERCRARHRKVLESIAKPSTRSSRSGRPLIIAIQWRQRRGDAYKCTLPSRGCHGRAPVRLATFLARAARLSVTRCGLWQRAWCDCEKMTPVDVAFTDGQPG